MSKKTGQPHSSYLQLNRFSSKIDFVAWDSAVEVFYVEALLKTAFSPQFGLQDYPCRPAWTDLCVRLD